VFVTNHLVGLLKRNNCAVESSSNDIVFERVWTELVLNLLFCDRSHQNEIYTAGKHNIEFDVALSFWNWRDMTILQLAWHCFLGNRMVSLWWTWRGVIFLDLAWRHLPRLGVAPSSWT